MKWKRFPLLFFLSAAIGIAGMVRLTEAVNVSTKAVATPAVVTLSQAHYRLYQNSDSLNPATPFAAEDTAVDAPAIGTQVRLRMNIADSILLLPSGATFKLQYANATSGAWADLSTSTSWIFFNNPAVADGQIIATTLLALSTVGESYGESNPSAVSPTQLLPGDKGEWDWSLVNNSADTSLDWFFRMVYASGTVLNSYANYPKFTAVPPPSTTPPSSPPVVSAGGGTNYVVSGTAQLPVPPPLVPPSLQCIDFNGDNRVDIVDLSILLYHYGESGPNLGCHDLNRDGSVDFPDISILMYYWTS